ncbi:MAG: hypothetical protein ABI651_09815 [Verrucomicrobiota bacterium]
MKRLILILVVLVSMAHERVSAMSLRDSLGMFESGASKPYRCAADRVRGNSGEVSRFQIMPAVWSRYTSSREFEDPEIAWSVAQRILQDRTQWFLNITGRQPSALELYLLWNKPGHFSAVGFSTSRVSPHFKTRAQRFANLFHDDQLQSSSARRILTELASVSMPSPVLGLIR